MTNDRLFIGITSRGVDYYDHLDKLDLNAFYDDKRVKELGILEYFYLNSERNRPLFIGNLNEEELKVVESLIKNGYLGFLADEPEIIDMALLRDIISYGKKLTENDD